MNQNSLALAQEHFYTWFLCQIKHWEESCDSCFDSNETLASGRCNNSWKHRLSSVMFEAEANKYRRKHLYIFAKNDISCLFLAQSPGVWWMKEPLLALKSLLLWPRHWPQRLQPCVLYVFVSLMCFYNMMCAKIFQNIVCAAISKGQHTPLAWRSTLLN